MILLFFLIAALGFGTASYMMIRYNGREMYVAEEDTKRSEPVLLSEIDIPSYVSLPAAFEGIHITEDEMPEVITTENVDAVIYDNLLSSAIHGDIVKVPCLIIADYTITKNGEYVERKNDCWLGFNNNDSFEKQITVELLKAEKGTVVYFESVDFLDYTEVDLELTIKDIIYMPYPVTDEYINKNTEYKSLNEMRIQIQKLSQGDAISTVRENTLSTLIDQMVMRSTFMEIPDSLIMQELQILRKSDTEARYEDAKVSLRRLFFMAAMIDKYNLASSIEMEKRYQTLATSEKESYSEYEIERMKLLLFEEEVINDIYKKIHIG